MNVLTLIRRIKKEAHADAMRNSENPYLNREYKEVYNERKDQLRNEMMNDYVEARLFCLEAEIKFRELAREKGLIKHDDEKLKCTYFITIRPDERIINIHEFFQLVEKFITRKCFKRFTLTFEQKGESVEEYGKGFHTHIIVEAAQRSKGELLRDTQSTFKCCTSANCIEVVVLKTQKDYENCESYILDYTSDDGHKEVTKAHDPVWRETIGLKAFYTQDDVGSDKRLPSIKSVIGQAIKVSTGCYVVDLAN